MCILCDPDVRRASPVNNTTAVQVELRHVELRNVELNLVVYVRSSEKYQFYNFSNENLINCIEQSQYLMYQGRPIFRANDATCLAPERHVEYTPPFRQ